MGDKTQLASEVIQITPAVAGLLANLIAAERARTPDVSDDEIFERNGVKFDENDRKLLADLERLTKGSE